LDIPAGEGEQSAEDRIRIPTSSLS
jgi:hypothetical protein